MTKRITIALSEAEAAHLRATAEREAMSVDDVVAQMIHRQMDHDIWFRRKVEDGLGAIDRGEVLSDEQVKARAWARRAELVAKSGET